MTVQALTKPEFTARSPEERINVLMIVSGAEAAQDNTTFVGFAVAVGVLEKEQVCAVADVSAAVGQFDAGGDHQAIGENGYFIAVAIVVGVLEDEDFVIGLLAG